MGDVASDDDLVARASGGDLAAFEALVERHTEMVYRVAVRILGDRDDADDATQDTFVELWRSLDTFRGESALTTWLYRITVHRCMRLLRKRRGEPPLPDVILSLVDDPARVTEARSQLQHLGGVLAERLTAEQRAALVLRELEGCSYDEIGTILGITVSAVKSRLHRARAEVVDGMRSWR